VVSRSLIKPHGTLRRKLSPPAHVSPERRKPMFALMLTLFTFCVAGAACVAAADAAAAVVKFSLHAIFWPLKLLLLPVLLVFLIIKVAFIVTAAVVIFALLLPVFVVGLLLAAPLVALSALT